MSNWETITLDECVKAGDIELGRGNIISKDDINNFSGPYPIYSSSAHNNGKFGEYAKFMFDEELITWSVDGGGSFFYRPKHRFSVTNVCGFMRVKSEKIHAPFIYYSLTNQHKQLTFDYTTKAHPSVIRKLYWLPKIDASIQKKISSILRTIDQAIEKTEALIEKYQQIKAGLMHDLFTRGIDEDGKLRSSREQAPELYQETPIGWIPKDWDFMPFDDCIDLLTDYHANGAYEILKKHVELLDYPDFAVMIRTTNFEQNDFERDVKYISKDAFSFLSKSAVQPNDILMNKIANPGVTYLMPDLGVPVSLGMNLFLLRLKNSFSPAFIQAYLEFREDYVKSFSNGTGTKTITKDAVRSLIVVTPKKNDEVNRITNLLSKLNKKINIENEHLIRSKNIKDGLMHDLLTDKVQVRLNNVEADHV